MLAFCSNVGSNKMPSNKRKRHVGGETLCDTLRKLVVDGGKSWFCYDEAVVVRDSKCDGQAILRYAHVAAALRVLQPNLAFKKTDVARVMEKICTEFYQSWGMSQDQSKDWLETMTRRLRNFLHQISAAEAKKTKPETVLKLPWLATPQ